jgi:hypothetical protein
MRNWTLSLAIILIALLFSRPLLAHHGEANYDTDKATTVKGIVTNFQFINPHVQIFLDVKNDKGEIEKWVGEARSPAMLVRIGGWDKNTIKVGDVIMVTGHRAKNGSTVLRLLSLTLPNGREMPDL